MCNIVQIRHTFGIHYIIVVIFHIREDSTRVRTSGPKRATNLMEGVAMIAHVGSGQFIKLLSASSRIDSKRSRGQALSSELKNSDYVGNLSI
jgi:hypothetical protein